MKLIGWLDAIATMPIPYTIAEIGVNHENDLGRAIAMVHQVAEAGGHAVKFQAYRAEKLAAIQSPAYWDTTKTPERSQRELFAKYDKFTVRDYEKLKAVCVDVGLDFLVTAFDPELVDALDHLVPAWKVASADLTNEPYLRHIVSKGKPIILSTGASYYHEVERALEITNPERTALLHCVLEYPCPREHANLRAIRVLPPARLVGYSDHVNANADMDVLVTAWLLGAQVIEKHFTDDKGRPGNDHHHAMDYRDLATFIGHCLGMAPLLGDGHRTLDHEHAARQHARRSWHATRDLPAGHVLMAGDVVALRPGHGIPPSEPVNGLVLDVALAEGECLTSKHIAMVPA